MVWKCPVCGSENEKEMLRCPCGYEDMGRESEESLSPIMMTLLACLGIEGSLIFICRFFTDSFLMALVTSVAIFALPSLYVGPYLYKRFK